MTSVCIPVDSRGFLAVHDGRVVFAPKPKKNADIEKLLSATKAKELGEDGVIMELKDVKSIVVHHDAAGTTVIDGKGLSVIVTNIPNDENREKIIDAVTVTRTFTRTEKKSGLLATARMPFLFFLISIIMTFGGVMASLQANGDVVDSGTRSGRRGAQQEAFAELVTALGTGGTALVGGIFIAAFGAWLFYKLKHNRYQIEKYQVV